MSTLKPASLRRSYRAASVLCGALLTLVSGVSSAASIVSQTPLSVGGNVPGNLLLVPSVEWPTLDSMANLGNYDVTRTYVGYFDPNKCYKYKYDTDESKRHFYPNRKDITSHQCDSAQKEWSGNYLNWAATQTIDPFRKALTGGYRVLDTTSETWLEKARSDANTGTSIFPDRRLPSSGSNSTTVKQATPFSWNSITIRIRTLGNRMYFTSSGSLDTTSPIAYDPSGTPDSSKVYEVSVRVKVCDASVGVETNCTQYGSNWKPEGLIQKYSNRIRFSVFGYLNDSDMKRDGGILRAQQKFVGANLIDPKDLSTKTNPNREWDPSTGIFVRNPDSADASATTTLVGKTIEDSGVINYINKFGQMTTQNHKSHDPVSELFYTALRYLKNQAPVAAYSDMSGASDSTTKYNWADGFPVITKWDDPIQYWCQNNAILGIGDANTHRDKNLPGNKRTNDEPTTPSEVSSDTTIDVVKATEMVAKLQKITINVPFSGRENSAYIAGLAYDAHTKDLRPDKGDFEGDQTVSTYWVDVREAQKLENIATNQYWLAAKYGGFTVPDGYKQGDDLKEDSWNSGETLENGDPRPENFYVASEADKMVESLTRAFAKIAAESVGSAASLAANSTRLETDTKTFQAQFYNGSWRGELKAFNVNSDGQLATTPAWTASAQLTAKDWTTRKIYTYTGSGSPAYKLFTYDNLTSTQKTALGGSSNVVNYIRGDRSKEESKSGGTLRTRTSVLGDIVNSTPVYVGKPNDKLYVGATFSGASTYATGFATLSTVKNRTPVVYVGANDGMLHGFNANTGEETYAYVPRGFLTSALKDYASPDYEHRYFVDGEIAVADFYDTSASKWKTALVGTFGRGGPGVFALDVTDPTNVKFLWEKLTSDTGMSGLGKNIGRPVIAQVANGDWRVLIGNGPDSADGKATLYSIGLKDGNVKKIDASETTGNGLSAVLARDSDGDGFADVAYGGDLKGTLWKFSSLSATSPTVTSLFSAVDPDGDAQAITAAPLAGKDPGTGKIWVFFGTGRYLDTPDTTDMQVQTWYGLIDTGAEITGRTDLIERSILKEGTISGIPVRVIEEGAENDMVGKKGWFMDLITPPNTEKGERMVLPNRFQGMALIGTTRIPEVIDPCRPSGNGFVMAIDPFTGARLAKTFYDVNGDGKFDNSDMLDGDIISGIGLPSSPSNPIFVGDMMHVGQDDGTMTSMKTQGSAADSTRMSWRELLNQ